MIEVIPAIIPHRLSDVVEGVSRVKGLVDWVQIDIVDGKFADARTWPYQRSPDDDFTKLLTEEEGLPDWQSVDYELDMMVDEPEKKLDDWIRAGISSAIFHVECRGNLEEAIEKARYADLSVGLALNPSTPNEVLEGWMEDIDFVQCMGNDLLGRHGVDLDRRVLAKISALRKSHPDLIIGIDIGVNEETAPLLVDAGASRLVSGSALFDSTDIEGTIEFFRQL